MTGETPIVDMAFNAVALVRLAEKKLAQEQMDTDRLTDQMGNEQ